MTARSDLRDAAGVRPGRTGPDVLPGRLQPAPSGWEQLTITPAPYAERRRGTTEPPTPTATPSATSTAGRPVQQIPPVQPNGFARPATGDGMDRYRNQKLDWEECGGGLTCASDPGAAGLCQARRDGAHPGDRPTGSHRQPTTGHACSSTRAAPAGRARRTSTTSIRRAGGLRHRRLGPARGRCIDAGGLHGAQPISTGTTPWTPHRTTRRSSGSGRRGAGLRSVMSEAVR